MSVNLDDNKTSKCCPVSSPESFFSSSNAFLPLNVDSELLECNSVGPQKHVAFAPVKAISNLDEGHSSPSVNQYKLKKVLH